MPYDWILIFVAAVALFGIFGAGFMIMEFVEVMGREWHTFKLERRQLKRDKERRKRLRNW